MEVSSFFGCRIFSIVCLFLTITVRFLRPEKITEPAILSLNDRFKTLMLDAEHTIHNP